MQAVEEGLAVRRLKSLLEHEGVSLVAELSSETTTRRSEPAVDGHRDDDGPLASVADDLDDVGTHLRPTSVTRLASSYDCTMHDSYGCAAAAQSLSRRWHDSFQPVIHRIVLRLNVVFVM